MLMQKEQAGEGAERRFDTHQRAECASGKASQCDHLQGVGQGGGQNCDANGDRDQGGRQQRGARMHDADRCDEQGRNHHAECSGLNTIVVPSLLAE